MIIAYGCAKIQGPHSRLKNYNHKQQAIRNLVAANMSATRYRKKSIIILKVQ